jgi:hypothetical protein
MKRLRFGDVLGVVALAFAIFAYFRPPDPSHPLSFDWVSKRFEIPLWQVFLAVAVIVWATERTVRHSLVKQSINPVAMTELGQLKKQNADLRSENAKLRSEVIPPNSHSANPPEPQLYGGGYPTEKLPSFDDHEPIIDFKWSEGLAIVIDGRTNNGQLLITACNHTPDYLNQFLVEIAEANSWNTQHETFLPNRGFNRHAVVSEKSLDPIAKTAPQVMLIGRMDPQRKQQTLYVGYDIASPLIWPNNDPSTTEIWRLKIAAAYKATANATDWTPLTPVHLLVRFDRQSGNFDVAKYHD